MSKDECSCRCSFRTAGALIGVTVKGVWSISPIHPCYRIRLQKQLMCYIFNSWWHGPCSVFINNVNASSESSVNNVFFQCMYYLIIIKINKKCSLTILKWWCWLSVDIYTFGASDHRPIWSAGPSHASWTWTASPRGRPTRPSSPTMTALSSSLMGNEATGVSKSGRTRLGLRVNFSQPVNFLKTAPALQASKAEAYDKDRL